jgi:hypothetical protein
MHFPREGSTSPLSILQERKRRHKSFPFAAAQPI